MATFNGAAHLLEQLESLVAQTRQPDELVISDDASTDVTTAVIRDFAARSPFRVRLIGNRDRLGSTLNFGRAVSECTGDIVALCDQDDVWRPEKLALIEEAFDDRGLGLVFSDAEVVDEQLSPLGYSLWESVGFDPRSRQLVRCGRAFDFMLGRWFVTGATAAFRSDFKPLLLPFATGLPGYIHDRWAALLIAAVSRIDFIDQKLVLYRQHGTQQLGSRRMTTSEDLRDRMSSRRERLEIDRSALDALTARLSEHLEWKGHPAFLAAVEARRQHLDARLGLSRARSARLTPILRELASGRYHRCSSGLLSALKDLVL
jgi:glycosyltransferase involved in cell wall biosynthesis